tara:strand:- start:377 stop:604 length:228 start_codon:yes stop_codon:yes gene_type:complete
MENKTMLDVLIPNGTLVSNNVEFACDLADQMLEMDGWGAEWNDDGDGNQSYTEETQERFNQYYSLIMEALDNAKD